MGGLRGAVEGFSVASGEVRPHGTDLADEILALTGKARGHESADVDDTGDDGTGGDGTGDGDTEPPLDPPAPDPVPTQTGTSGDDVLTGTTGNDYLSAGDGHDYLLGLDGDDRIDGGNGDDVLDGGAGADELNGGAGLDLATYSGSSAGVTISLAAGTGTGGDAEGDTPSGIENINGSKFDDVLIGDAGDNRLFGDDGDDLLVGGAGADLLVGWNGNDTVDYSTSSGAVNVNLDARTAAGGDAEGDFLSMVENLIGSSGNDTLTGDLQANELTGGAGDDQMTGGDGSDVFIFATAGSGMDGNDTITDFEHGTDIIRYDGGAFDLATGLTITQDGADALVASDYGTIRLSGVDASLIDDNSFGFGDDPGFMV